MKTLAIVLGIAALTAFTAVPVAADSDAFRNIIGDAANIQLDAEALRGDLDAKKIDEAQIKMDVAALSKHVAALRKDVDALDANLASLTDAQKKSWEEAKSRAQLLTVYADLKSMETEAGNITRNRANMRGYAAAMIKHASDFQRYINHLDR